MPRPPLNRWDDLPLEKVTEMVATKTVAGGARTLRQMYLKKGAIVPRHAHEAERLVYVLQGALRAWLDGEPVVVREGEVLTVPPSSPHQVEALDDTFVLTVR